MVDPRGRIRWVAGPGQPEDALARAVPRSGSARGQMNPSRCRRTQPDDATAPYRAHETMSGLIGSRFRVGCCWWRCWEGAPSGCMQSSTARRAACCRARPPSRRSAAWPPASRARWSPSGPRPRRPTSRRCCAPAPSPSRIRAAACACCPSAACAAATAGSAPPRPPTPRDQRRRRALREAAAGRGVAGGRAQTLGQAVGADRRSPASCAWRARRCAELPREGAVRAGDPPGDRRCRWARSR